MANIKFSEFTAETAIAAGLFVVGYDGATNKRILATDLLGDYLPLAGGTMTGDTLHGTNVKSRWGTMQVYNDGTHNNFLILSGDVRYNNFGQGDDISFTLTSPTGSSGSYFKLSGQNERIEVGVDMRFGQSDKAIFNDSLEIYSTNTGASFIKDTEASNFLTIQSGADLKLQSSGGEDYIICNENSSVELYYDNLKKLETTSTGANITDTLGVLGDFTNPGLLKLYAPISANYVGIKGPLDAGTSYDLQLPNTLPNVANQILESNASGTLSWIATPGGGGGGATELNDLTDVEIGSFTSALINVPSSGIGSYSFVMGIGAGNSMTTGAQSNTFIGYNAGNASDGDNHVMIGAHAGERNVANVAFGNVMIGRYAGRGAVGSNAHSTIAIGESALEAVTGGDRNIAVGFHALRRLTTAGTTIAIGNEAGEFIVDKSDSVLIGYQAMENANSGQCVVIGAYANDTAVTNFGTGAIHIGYQAGRSSTGNRRINIGWTAGTAQTTGGGVNIGERAGASNTSSQGRVCVGGYSAQYNTGNSNTFIGEYSGQGISGSSTGHSNTTLGYKSMEDLTSAQYNTAIGINAGSAISTGMFNTILGGHSGNPAGKLTTGSYNVLLGVNAQGSTATVNNEVSIFNNSVFARFQGSASAWSFVSDKRDKKDIKDLELGLDFVDKLKPRKFKWNLRSSDKDDGIEASGFIAQEIKETLDESGIDYTGIVNTDDPNQYTVAQANIIPMLVKAIQELKAEIEILKS